MLTYKEWFNSTKDLKLGSCVCYRQTRLDRLLAKVLPHVVPFISKRRRVAIRSYWKCRHSRRACTALCKLLMKQEYKPFHAMPDFADELYEWEIVNKED